jgi:hypothetical protein
MAKDDKVSKLLDTVKKDLPKLVKENKGAAIGAVAGYFLADTLNKHEGVIVSLLGALVGHAVDEKTKDKKEF